MESEFIRLGSVLEADAAKRETISKEVKEINRIFRSIQFELSVVHNVCADDAAVQRVCLAARGHFQQLAPYWKRIFDSIGQESVEKYRGHWRFATEQLVFLAAFMYWLETRELISIDQASQLIGVGINEIYSVPSVPSTANPPSSLAPAASSPAAPAAAAAPTGVGLDLDDYLQGLTALPKELSRLCINCVRTANYTLPQRISAFVTDLYSGFRLLNLRNDALRRKFDAIKYDVAKIEEVLYDCTVRGLGSSNKASSTLVNEADSKPLAVKDDVQMQQ